MSCLDKLVEQVLADLNNGLKDDTVIRNLLKYPLDQRDFVFILEEKDLSYFYVTYLPRIMLEILALCKTQNIFIRNLIAYCTKHSKADFWLECLLNHLKFENVVVLNIVLSELTRFVFELNRLVCFYGLCLEKPLCSMTSASTTMIWEQNCRMLVRIPSIIHNLGLNYSTNKLTNIDRFVDIVLKSCLELDSNSDDKYKFFGLIISHLALSGYSNEVSTFICKQSPATQANTWCKSLKFIKNQSFEMCIVPIIRLCSDVNTVHRLLFKDIECDNVRLQSFLRLFSRLCFVRYFSSATIIRKIFCAFAMCLSESTDEEMCTKLVGLVDDRIGKPVFKLWADYSAIQSTPLVRHIYVSQILLSWIIDFRTPVSSKLSVEVIIDEYLSDILSGISNHLSSPREEIRLIGMIMGEWLMKTFNLSRQSEQHELLKFDYDDGPILHKLRPYFLPLDLSIEYKEPKSNTPNDEDKCVQELTHLDLDKNSKIQIDSDDEPCSDDDNSTESKSFKPLPANPSNLILKCSKLKKPRYLRECLDGMMLTKTEDHLTNLACTMTAEELIYGHPVAASELAVEFCRVFVNIEPPATPYPLEVNEARHRGLIAVGVVAPIECARYLTNEFCQSNYSIGQRLNIIAAITDIACKLSGVDKIVKYDPSKSSLLPLHSASANKFAKCAGEFFFPLLQSIPQLVCLSSRPSAFCHQDASVLANLVAALATLFICSRWAPIQLRMAEELFDLIPLLHRHPEPAVRRALLVAAGAVVSHMPSSVWIANPQLLFGPKKMPFGIDACDDGSIVLSWLKSCAADDFDSECQQLAQAGLASLYQQCMRQ